MILRQARDSTTAGYQRRDFFKNSPVHAKIF